MMDATPLLRAWAAPRLAALATQDAAATQQRQLFQLLRHAATTQFGRAHGFSRIRTVDDFQRRVPLRLWADFWREWWQPAFPHLTDVSWPGTIPYFAKTSGTTAGVTKHIPVSRDMVRSNRRAALHVLAFHLSQNSGSRVLGGKNFILGGSTALEVLAPGVRAGDLSGIAAEEIPWFIRSRSFPSRNLALIGDWQRKVEEIAPRSLAVPVTSFSGTPSWMVLFFQKLAGLRPPGRAVDCYPALELVIHGGVGFAPYRARFAEWLEGSRAGTREVYPASEGFFAIADTAPGEGLRLLLDNGLFFEFVRPEELGSANPNRRWIATAELGEEYALVVSSNAGLFAHVVGDTVRLVSRTPPRVLVTGRTAWSLSVAGEHLTGAELDAAVEHAARAVGGMVADYAAAALHPDADDPRGGHVFVVELEAAEPMRFAAELDAALACGNEDYAAHRAGDYGMRPPQVIVMPPGGFAEWMRRRGRLGGQNKVPRVIADPGLLSSLLGFARGKP
jgi:hypothetical protein